MPGRGRTGWGRNGWSGASGRGPAYLLLDRFLTDASAPLTSPRTCEPGPGTLTVTDTGNKLSVSGGLLTEATGGAAGDPSIVSPTAVSRVAGRAVIVSESEADAGAWLAGFSPTSPGLGSGNYIYPGINLNTGGYNGSLILDFLPKHSSSIAVATVLRSTGAFYVARIDGGAWTLGWVDDANSSASVYPGLWRWAADGATVHHFAKLRVVDIPSWSSDDTVYTDYEASPTATSTGSHTADCLLEWTQTTVPSGGTQQIDFRRASETERWYLTLDSAGTITLYEDTGGSDTARGSYTGVANGNRIVVIADSTTIKVYVANALRITYTSASSNATATTWYVTSLGTGGAIANLYAWPRYPSFPGGV